MLRFLGLSSSLIYSETTFNISFLLFKISFLLEEVRSAFSGQAIQKQPSRCVLRKMCSENMQQIYVKHSRRIVMSIKLHKYAANLRRTPVLKYDFIEITLRHGCSPVYLLHIFRTRFLKNTSGWLLLAIIFLSVKNRPKCNRHLLFLYFLHDLE